MALQIRNSESTVTEVVSPKPRRIGHTRARPVSGIDLSQPGRLRVGHMLTLFGVSHSTLYSHIKAGRIPKADGSDGTRSYWLTATVVQALK
jgi:predicted DNA-binding transcriptional regulator AlpA